MDTFYCGGLRERERGCMVTLEILHGPWLLAHGKQLFKCYSYFRHQTLEKLIIKQIV